MSVFKMFKVGGSRGMLPREKLNVQDFRNVILSGILAEINIAIFSNQIIEWFSSCFRVRSIVRVVQEKFEVWEPQEH